MITLNISCDICRKSESFPFNTGKRKMYEMYHRIKKNDICPECVTKAIIKKDYIPMGTKIIIRDLMPLERKKVIGFYNLNY